MLGGSLDRWKKNPSFWEINFYDMLLITLVVLVVDSVGWTPHITELAYGTWIFILYTVMDFCTISMIEQRSEPLWTFYENKIQLTFTIPLNHKSISGIDLLVFLFCLFDEIPHNAAKNQSNYNHGHADGDLRANGHSRFFFVFNHFGVVKSKIIYVYNLFIMFMESVI